MGNLIATIFLLLATIFSSWAFAQEVNLLKNPGFESRTSQWAKTGSSTFTIESASPLDGVYSAKWNASASGEFLRSSTYTIPAGLKGTTCLIEMKYLWDTGTSGHILMNVDDGTNNIATLSLDPTSGGVPRKAQLNFTCPTSGTVRFELESTANATEITFDNGHLGSGKNAVQISQAELYAGVVYNNAANCDVTTTSASVVEVADDADCNSRTAVGNAQFVNNRFKMLVPRLPKGNYELSVMVPVYSDTSGTTCEVYINGTGSNLPATYVNTGFQTGIGNNPSGTVMLVPFTQTSDVSNISFFMEWRRAAGAGTCHMATVNAGAAVFAMSLKKFPTQSAEAVTLETSGWRVDANIGGANPALGSGAISVYSPIEDTGLDLVNNSGLGVISAQIPCSSTNPPTGATCAAGSESIGVTFNAPYAGDVVACVSFAQEINTGAGGSVTSSFQIVETPSNAQTILQEGKSRVTSQNRQASSIVNQPMRLCGTFTFASAGQKTLRLNLEQSTVATVSNNLILADRDASNGQRDIHWEVYPINQGMPAPVFTEVKEKVASNATGEKIERARINNNGATCPIVHQSGSWVSATRSGTGVCALTFTGFSSAPACVVMSAGGAADVANQGAVTPTSTGMTVSTFVSNTGAVTDKAFDIICMGPK